MNIGIDFNKFKKEEVTQVMTNYTKMPNTIIDDCIMAGVSDKAFKCLMFIMRQTVGFNRTSHTIAATQFQKYCGIKKDETVAKVIRELEQCKLITVKRKTGCLNEYVLTLNQYHEMGLPLSEGTTPTEQGYTTPTKRGSIKETLKENIKEIHTQGNSSQDDNAWKPEISFLRTLLYQTKFGHQTDAVLGMVDFEFHLGNFNAHWENKMELTENQKTRKFAAWLIQEFERAEQKAAKTKKAGAYQPVSTKNTKTMQAHDEFFAQYGIGSNVQDSDFIDGYASEIKTIEGEV